MRLTCWQCMVAASSVAAALAPSVAQPAVRSDDKSKRNRGDDGSRGLIVREIALTMQFCDARGSTDARRSGPPHTAVPGRKRMPAQRAGVAAPSTMQFVCPWVHGTYGKPYTLCTRDRSLVGERGHLSERPGNSES